MPSIKMNEASILVNLLHMGILFDDSRDFIKFHLFQKTVQVVVPDLSYLIRVFYLHCQSQIYLSGKL
jgi:hypothetical protein